MVQKMHSNARKGSGKKAGHKAVLVPHVSEGTLGQSPLLPMLKLCKHMDQLTNEVLESSIGEEADLEPEEPSKELGMADATSLST